MDLNILNYGHVTLISASISLMQMYYLRIRLQQNLQYLTKPIHFHWTNIDLFTRQDIKTFENIFLFDKTRGTLYFIFLLLNFPANAYLVMSLILNQTIAINSFIYAMDLVVQQISSIGIFHLQFAFFTRLIHKSAKHLIKLSIKNQHKVGNFKSKLKLSLTIARLHTRRQYGITYGSFIGSLITLNTFVKVSKYFQI